MHMLALRMKERKESNIHLGSDIILLSISSQLNQIGEY